MYHINSIILTEGPVDVGKPPDGASPAEIMDIEKKISSLPYNDAQETTKEWFQKAASEIEVYL